LFPFIFISLLVFWLQPVFASPSPFEYSIRLYENKEYYRSISEILRLEFQYPEQSSRHQLHLYLLKNYYESGDHENVRKTAQEIFQKPSETPSTEIKKEAARFLSFSLLQQGKEIKSRKIWEELVNQGKDDTFPQASSISDQIDPDTAKTWSAIIPGAGLFLTGEYFNGTVSFLLNGIFLAGIYQAVQNQQWGITGLLVFFEWGWYFGGQNAAMVSAINHNKRLITSGRNKWIEKNRNPDGSTN